MSGENPKKIIENHVDRVRVAYSWRRPPAVTNLLELLDFQTLSHLLDLQTPHPCPPLWTRLHLFQILKWHNSGTGGPFEVPKKRKIIRI